ncbi:MAG: hypothetical protein KH054_07275 [Firmicutes bacterium]|nr:hypothetical protein [Bacillota bacterium]
MCNTCCNTCNAYNTANACGGGLFNTLFGNSCQCCNCGNNCGCNAARVARNAAANACRCAAVAAQAAAQANSGCCGCGCGCGCGCRRRVAVPITGRIYLELPYGGFGAQAAEATTGTGGGCTMCNTAVTGVNANGGGFDSYYARQYGLYPYSATNTCGCGN